MSDVCAPPLIEQWRRRFARRFHSAARTIAAMGYLTSGPGVEDLIEVEKLMLVTLYDELDSRGNVSTRLAGFGGARIPWGVRWGGPENSRFFKNLKLQPMPGAHDLRLDMASAEALCLGLQLDRDIERQLRFGYRCKHDRLRLPHLWAGFRSSDAVNIAGEGPELALYCDKTGYTPRDAMAMLRREYFGLTLLPFAWVGHEWQKAVAVFADLRRFPLRQIFPVANLPDNLIGFHGVAEFDFYNSRFRLPAAPSAILDSNPRSTAS